MDHLEAPDFSVEALCQPCAPAHVRLHRIGVERLGGGDVDAARAGFAQVREGLLHHIVRADEVDIDHGPEAVVRDAVERRNEVARRARDKNIDLAMRGDRFGEGLADAVMVAHVLRDADALTALVAGLLGHSDGRQGDDRLAVGGEPALDAVPLADVGEGGGLALDRQDAPRRHRVDYVAAVRDDREGGLLNVHAADETFEVGAFQADLGDLLALRVDEQGDGGPGRDARQPPPRPRARSVSAGTRGAWHRSPRNVTVRTMSSADADLAATVQWLRDRVLIEQLPQRYARGLDSREFDAARAVWNRLAREGTGRQDAQYRHDD